MPTVVVTGNSSGIGAAIATRLAREGWSVIGVDRAAVSASRGLVAQHQVDLADGVAVEALARSLPRVEGLVHAAGMMKTGTLETLASADGEYMWAVHVRALTLLAAALVPGMPAGGRIVAIGSRTSAGAAGKSQYAASKAAVTALIRSWAIELAGRGITANVIAPAATATAMLAAGSRIGVPPVLPPIGRFIQPDEIAAYVSFLLTPEAGAVTGQELLVCGGASL